MPEAALDIPTGPHQASNVVPDDPANVPWVFVPGTNKLANIAQVAFSYRLAIVMVMVSELQSDKIDWKRMFNLIV